MLEKLILGETVLMTCKFNRMIWKLKWESHQLRDGIFQGLKKVVGTRLSIVSAEKSQSRLYTVPRLIVIRIKKYLMIIIFCKPGPAIAVRERPPTNSAIRVQFSEMDFSFVSVAENYTRHRLIRNISDEQTKN